MIKFTRTRLDWDSISFGERMLKAGSDGYKSIIHELDADLDGYVLISTGSYKKLRDFTQEDLENIWNELETLGEKESKTFEVSSGEIVELYWEIDRFS
jgi:outer membrane protein assembly factor BamB